MELRRGHLAYFIAVAEEGQITRAAARLHLAQPALSQAMAQLEADIGVQLLRRHARGVALTPAGEAFLTGARAAVAAWADAIAQARTLDSTPSGTLHFGFLGAPPGLDSATVLRAFNAAYPQIEVRFRELPFPPSATDAWLADVDVAVCHLPPLHPGVWMQPLRTEPRVVIARSSHHLAQREQVDVADVLDETFVGFGAAVDRAWAGFWSLDDHRGGPPAHATSDGVASAQEVLAALAVRDAITTVPAAVARVIMGAVEGIATVGLAGARPATIALVGREDRSSPQVAAVRRFRADFGIAREREDELLDARLHAVARDRQTR